MLTGGSKDDNLFQINDLLDHLDLIHQVGGNYVRNVMSSRDAGNLMPFLKLPGGKYDLDQWNPAYWIIFEKFLDETAKRDIIVQIELWDQWDFSAGLWDKNPWNPDQNVNYSTSNTRLKGDGHYADLHADGGVKKDFFATVPKLHNDQMVLHFQQKFVDKVLSYTFQHGHVLYTITNEFFVQHSPDWGLYWAEFIHKKASEAGVYTEVTEMWQAGVRHEHHRVTMDNPEIFNYLDISQNSGRGDSHWNNLQWVRDYISDHIRPINHTKIYGRDGVGWTGTDDDGIERFWINIFGGAASVRFHRPGSGMGLGDRAQKQIRSARMMLDVINIFKCKPDVDHQLLSGREANEAYLTYIPNETYVLYFPKGGSVKLNLSEASGTFQVRWLNVEESKWAEESSFQAGKEVTLESEKGKNWIAVIRKR